MAKNYFRVNDSFKAIDAQVTCQLSFASPRPPLPGGIESFLFIILV